MRNRIVALFVYDGLCTFEFGIAAEIFGLERPEMEAEWYRFLAFAERPGTYRTNSGVQVGVTELVFTARLPGSFCSRTARLAR